MRTQGNMRMRIALLHAIIFGAVFCVQVTLAVNPADSILQWQSFRFGEFCQDSSSFDSFFEILENDVKKGLDLTNPEDKGTLLAYIRVRDNWINSPNLQNFRMALVITRALCQLLGMEIHDVVNSKSRPLHSMQGDHYYRNVTLSGQSLFQHLDNQLSKIGEYRELSELTEQEGVGQNPSAWSAYIDQFGLSYRDWGKITYLSSSSEDPILLQLVCLRDHLRTFDTAELVQRCASLVDLRNKLELIYSVLRNLNDENIDKTIITKLIKKREENNTQFLFTDTTDPSKAGVHAFDGLNYIATGVLCLKCPRLIKTTCGQ